MKGVMPFPTCYPVVIIIAMAVGVYEAMCSIDVYMIVCVQDNNVCIGCPHSS